MKLPGVQEILFPDTQNPQLLKIFKRFQAEF